MATTTLPEQTIAYNNSVLNTWYAIKEELADAVLNGTPITAALKMLGAMVSQVGGQDITRSVRYALPTTQGVVKGDVLTQGETENLTAARWGWRYIEGHVQASIFDDQVNSGENAMRNYVSQRITDTTDALTQRFETDTLRAEQITENDPRAVQGLYDMVPRVGTTVAEFTNDAATYGGINRPLTYTGTAPVVPSTGNTWWGPQYYPWTTPIEVNLVHNMTDMSLSLGDNRTSPNLYITDRATIVKYLDIAMDATQIIKKASGQLVDLGFDEYSFNGKTLIWSKNMKTAADMLVLNVDRLDWVWDPNMWFEMTNFKDTALSGERIAHVFCAMNYVTKFARDQGLIATTITA